MKQKIQIIARIIILLPIFIIVVTLWMPFMIIKDLWFKSAKEINNLFDKHNTNNL